jgi:hypothetical protein
LRHALLTRAERTIVSTTTEKVKVEKEKGNPSLADHAHTHLSRPWLDTTTMAADRIRVKVRHTSNPTSAFCF